MYCVRSKFTNHKNCHTIGLSADLFDLLMARGTWDSLLKDLGEVILLDILNVVTSHDRANSLTRQKLKTMLKLKLLHFNHVYLYMHIIV